MAEHKSGTTAKRAQASKTPAARKPAAAPKKNTKTAQQQAAPAPAPRPPRDENALLHRVLPYVFVVCAVLAAVCFIVPNSGTVGNALKTGLLGLFGPCIYALPLLLVYFAIDWRSWVAEGAHVMKSIFALVVTLFLGALIQLISIASGAADGAAGIVSLYNDGANGFGGGALGGIIGVGMYRAFAATAGIILSAAVLLTFGLFLFGLTPKKLWINFRYSMQMRRERRDAAEAARKREREFDYESGEETENFVPPEAPAKPAAKKPSAPAFDIGGVDDTMGTLVVTRPDPNEPFDPLFGVDAPTDAAEKTAEMPTADAPEAGGTEITDIPPDAARPIYDASGRIDLEAIFVNPAPLSPAASADADAPAAADSAEAPEAGGIDIGDALGESATRDFAADADAKTLDTGDTLGVVREAVGTPAAAAAAPAKPPKPAYRFPPVTLLSPPEHKKNEDVGAELRANAQKLIETLRSFHVNVSISSVSRGPTITRYELIPEAGTRVRSIANLVDDISLSLATSGIRIEAPIPGKAAVGIEVPNKVVSTVALRELIEDKSFKEAKSRLTVCLGKDVGGAPIIFDIAKMPHLLIAGATGMGKSVCINSIITSILYKATPDEVKLMLIDPKKVEFNIYNGIPHLQTPVVSDPKKAAGALHWAVTEMERRYELIEEVGARKIETYNEIARTRGMEVLPYTVIIIDELADLMMTAPDAVEESICRLAQKARAAGMHIIIGTQRPSVDVITGLIKANIPSRIAFTVASQVDSRTIIDIAGAEKLIGRGDMLYYPVGLSKPMRAQGAFVSEDEVEKITNFVKQAAGETEYDSEIIESIEREAQTIGNTGKKGGGEAAEDAGSDPKLRDALEIATESGKISTSLLQRRLSIGYGRAAKIIDIMEARGFVSAPDGQKPREVLISKTQYREMVVNNDERLN